MRDSPGARERSTASIDGGTSNVGSGISGSTSSCESPFASTLDAPASVRELPIFHGGAEDDAIGDDGTDALDGESSESSPLVNDDARLCVRLRSGTRWRDVISMLPPPTIGRFSRRIRSPFSVFSCSCDIDAPARGVIDTVPRSWAYE